MKSNVVVFGDIQNRKIRRDLEAAVCANPIPILSRLIQEAEHTQAKALCYKKQLLVAHARLLELKVGVLEQRQAILTLKQTLRESQDLLKKLDFIK